MAILKGCIWQISFCLTEINNFYFKERIVNQFVINNYLSHSNFGQIFQDIITA
jgi:hypothetical protein